MKANFTAKCLKYDIIEELPGAWTDQIYRNLLETMDIDEVSEIPSTELKEMCLMALNDSDPEDAAKIILAYIFKDRLTKGQIDNISVEMLDEKMWEEYPDLSLHEDYFNASQILRDAFKASFPHPEAASFQVKVTTKNRQHLSVFEGSQETSLIRLLIQGMPDGTLIDRLFDGKLQKGEFPEAKDIIWQLKSESEDGGNSVVFNVISSKYWFQDLQNAEAFEATLLLEE